METIGNRARRFSFFGKPLYFISVEWTCQPHAFLPSSLLTSSLPLPPVTPRLHLQVAGHSVRLDCFIMTTSALKFYSLHLNLVILSLFLPFISRRRSTTHFIVAVMAIGENLRITMREPTFKDVFKIGHWQHSAFLLYIVNEKGLGDSEMQQFVLRKFSRVDPLLELARGL